MSAPVVDKATYFELARLACRCSKKQRALAEGHAKEPLRPIEEIGREAGYGSRAASAAALKLPNVRAYIDALLQSTRGEDRLSKELRPTLMGAREALERMALIARSSVADHLRRDETGRLTADIDLDKAYAVKQVKLHEYVDMTGGLHTEASFQMEDKKAALEVILRAHGVFQDDENRARRQDEARERLWRAYLAEHPEEVKKLHLKLLAVEADEGLGQIIEIPKAEVPVPSNGRGAPA